MRFGLHFIKGFIVTLVASTHFVHFLFFMNIYIDIYVIVCVFFLHW